MSCTSKWRSPMRAHGSLAHGGEGLGQQVVQALAGGVALAELLRLGGQLLIGKRLELRFQRVDLIDFGLVALQLLALAHREQFGEKSHRLRLLSVVGERSWGRRSPPLQQLPSPSLGGRAGRLGANLLHSTTERRWRAQFHRVCKAARPPSAPGCARLRPVAPSSAVPHHPAPSSASHLGALSRRSPVAPQSLRAPAPSHPSAHRTARRPSHSSPFALQRHRTPAPSHSCTVTPRPFASLLQSLPLLFPTASRSKAHSHTALQSSRKSLEIDHRPISPNQMLLFFELLEFRANSHHSTP